MTTKTKSDLVSEVLEQLNQLAVGQDPSPEDTTYVEGQIDNIVANMRADGTFYLGDTGSVPQEVLNPLGAVIAWGCRNKFGVGGEELVNLKAAHDEGIASLKKIQQMRPTFEPLKNEFI